MSNLYIMKKSLIDIKLNKSFPIEYIQIHKQHINLNLNFKLERS